MELPPAQSGLIHRTSLLVLDALSHAIGNPAATFLDPSDYSEHHLAGLFARQAIRQFHTPALVTPSSTWTYRNLLAAAIAVARELHADRDFVPQDRVLLLMPNSVEFVAAFYGTLLAGGCVVPLAPNLEKQALANIIDSTQPAAILVSAEQKRLNPALVQLPARRVTLNADICHLPFDLAAAGAADESQLAALFFTSGSSGTPKGVKLSHRNLIHNAASIQSYLEITSTDRPLCVSPFYHAFGNSVLQSHLLAGSTLILDGKPLFPESLVTALQEHQATSLSAVPDLIRLLLERTSLGTTPLPSLRYLAVAGGALPHSMAMTLSRRIAPARLFLMYGQTEATARLAYVPPEHLHDVKPGCVGRPIPGVELEVVDAEGHRVAPGESGEIRARGPNIMLGYWRDEAETSRVIHHGWLSTGDRGTVDQQGWIYHLGRLNAEVKIAGYRVDPQVLEEFISRNFVGVQAVCVPHETQHAGTRLALFLVLPPQSAVSRAMILMRCREELPRHLIPNCVRFLEAFPLNSSLKIDRRRLSEIAGDDPAEDMVEMTPLMTA